MFRSANKIKYMGNKGVVVGFTDTTVIVAMTGPLIFGRKTFTVGTKEFNQLKRG